MYLAMLSLFYIGYCSAINGATATNHEVLTWHFRLSKLKLWRF